MPIDEETKKRILSKGASPEQILGVSSPITLDKANKVYKKLSLQVHPDKNLDDVEVATEVFKVVSNAWDELEKKLSKKTPPQQSSGQSSHATRHAPKQNQESNPHTQSSPLSKQEELRQKIEIELNQINPKYIDEFKRCLGDVSLSKQRLGTLDIPTLEITLLQVQAARNLMYIWSDSTKEPLIISMGRAQNKAQLETLSKRIMELRQEEWNEKPWEKCQELKEKLISIKKDLNKPWYKKNVFDLLSSFAIPSKMKMKLVQEMLQLIQEYQLTDLDDAFTRGLDNSFEKRSEKNKMQPFKEDIKSIEVPSRKPRGG